MSILLWAVLPVLAGSGIILMVIAILLSRTILQGRETSRLNRVVNSILLGMSASLIFMSVVFVIGLLDVTYTWTYQRLMAIGLVSLFPGIVVTIGSYWQFFVATKFREHLYRALTVKKR